MLAELNVFGKVSTKWKYDFVNVRTPDYDFSTAEK